MRVEVPVERIIELSTTLNPYQGLKPLPLLSVSGSFTLSTTLNPYQGLKLRSKPETICSHSWERAPLNSGCLLRLYQ